MNIDLQTHQPSILIVDDEVTTRAILKARLGQKEGHQVLEASNGTEALKIAKNQIPTVIVLDWTMPDFSGIEVLQDLRECDDTKEIPVIMLTGKKLVSEVNLAFEMGAIEFIAKPIDLKQVSHKVNFYLNATH